MIWDASADERAEAIIARYPDRRSAVMPLLYLVMGMEGRLTEEGMRQVGVLTGMTPVQVESVASFYNMFKQEVGAHLVSVCRSISCHLRGAGEVLDAAVDAAGTHPGGTSEDGTVTVESAECIGACGGAPAIQVDYETVEGLTPEKVAELVHWLRQAKPAEVRGDDLQERFGGDRAFDWGPEEEAAARGPFPAFEPFGTVAP